MTGRGRGTGGGGGAGSADDAAGADTELSKLGAARSRPAGVATVGTDAGRGEAGD